MVSILIFNLAVTNITFHQTISVPALWRLQEPVPAVPGANKTNMSIHIFVELKRSFKKCSKKLEYFNQRKLSSTDMWIAELWMILNSYLNSKCAYRGLLFPLSPITFPYSSPPDQEMSVAKKTQKFSDKIKSFKQNYSCFHVYFTIGMKAKERFKWFKISFSK